MITSPSRIAGVALAIAVACGAVGFAPSPAVKADAQTQSWALGQTNWEPMTVIGYDSAVAADHGYELRTGPTGDQLSVPIGNPPGDFTGALGAASAGEGVTVPGDCGESWIYFRNGNTEIITGYLIKSDHGQAFSHIWSATVATEGMGGAVGTYDLSGLAPADSATWQAIRRIVEPYTSKASALAGGTAVTTAGWICSSGNPTAKYPE